jgi:hypothetical protein
MRCRHVIINGDIWQPMPSGIIFHTTLYSERNKVRTMNKTTKGSCVILHIFINPCYSQKLPV